MNYTLFSQLLNHLPKNIVEKAIDTFGTDKHSKGITTFNHLVSMLPSPLPYSHSMVAGKMGEGVKGEFFY